ncbi:MAG: glycosyltransferase family 2 protein [Candidatus Bathyarchaeia archaeon]
MIEALTIKAVCEGEKAAFKGSEAGLIDVSVVIPSLNEAETISECVLKAKEAFVCCGVKGEVVVADNSEDETPEIAKSLGARVVTPDRRGYGYAYHYGIKHARGKYIVMGDADGTYDFLEMPKLLKPLLKGEADLVIGSRFKGEIKKDAMPWLHRYFGNPALTAILNLFFKAGISDAHSGFRAARREALERLNLRSNGMEYASEMVLKAAWKGLKVKEVPITYHPRKGGRPKLNSFSDGWRHLKLMLIYAPARLYLPPGLALYFSGLLVKGLSYFKARAQALMA